MAYFCLIRNFKYFGTKAGFRNRNKLTDDSLTMFDKNKLMKRLIHSFWIVIIVFIITSCSNKEEQNYDNMIIRISEIAIEPKYLKEYLAILKEEAEASVRLENGVIAIYPMFQKKQANEIRILEIYASKEAYEAHLKTPHFQHYKTSTLKMVKSLNLVDMNAIDTETMSKIFKKITL